MYIIINYITNLILILFNIYKFLLKEALNKLQLNVSVSVKNENPHMRIHNVLEWAVLLNEGKPSLCNQ